MTFLFSHCGLLQVKVKLSLNAIKEYNVANGRLMVSGYLSLKWTDELLHWSSDDFGAVTRIGVARNDIWTPGIQQLSDGDAVILFSSAWLDHNGNVTMAITGELVGYCDVDVLYFPIDQQTCIFIIIAPSLQAHELRLTPLKDYVEIGVFRKHGEWSMKESAVYPIEYTDTDINLVVAGLQYNIKLQRRPLFVLLHTTAPLFLIALLNMVIYVVPVESGERISFAVSVLLALIFFTSNIGDSIPNTALTVPILSLLTVSLITLCTINVIISVIFSRTAAQKFKPVTGCLHAFIRFCLRCKFGNKFKRDQYHPGEIISYPVEDKEDSRTENERPKKKCGRRSQREELEITWLMVVDVFDWIMFYVHLVVVAAAMTIPVLYISGVL